MSVYGSGVAASLGLQPNPVGTPEELKSRGLDRRMIGSCAPPGPGVQGCQSYARCIFRLTRFGGFRDRGPRNIGYFLQTHESMKKEDECSCFQFMQRLYDRMRAGERDRQDGKNGEIIQVIAVEPGLDHKLSGEKIHRAVTVNINEGMNLPADYKKKIFTGEVKSFVRVDAKQAISYDLLLEDRRRLREMQDESLQEGPVHRLLPDEPDNTPAPIDLRRAAPLHETEDEDRKSVV